MKEPSDHVYVILQDHGPRNGGWGPAYVVSNVGPPSVFAYTGDDPAVIEAATKICQQLAQQMNKPTKLVRYSQREDVFSVAGSS